MKYKLIKFLLLISFFVGCNSCSKNNDAVHTENASLVTKLSEAYLQAPIIHQNCQYDFFAIRAHLYQMAGSAYFYCGKDIQKAIKQLENAIDVYRKGCSSPYMGRIFHV